MAAEQTRSLLLYLLLPFSELTAFSSLLTQQFLLMILLQGSFYCLAYPCLLSYSFCLEFPSPHTGQSVLPAPSQQVLKPTTEMQGCYQ